MTMRLRVRANGGAAVALIVLVAWWLWPGAPMDARGLTAAIHQFLRFEEGTRQTAELRDKGLAIPDASTALAWKARWDSIDALRVEPVEARRCRNPVPARRNRCVIARAKIAASPALAASQPWRYFRIRPLLDGSYLVLGETAAWAWHVRI